MDLKELITFRTIVHEGTFSKAAAKLNYAQSTVTHQVQRLERELGITLFERGWEAKLTPAGRVYAQQVGDLIKHWNSVLEQVKSLQNDEIGELNVGVIETLTDTVLPTVLQRFREYKPNITCNFIVGNTETLTKRLIDESIDFAICAEPNDIHPMRFEPIYNEEISFIVSKSHPFAGKTTLTIQDLYEYPVIIGGTNCLYHLRMEREFARVSGKPFFHSVSQISSIPAIVQRIPSVGVVLTSIRLSSELISIPVDMSDPHIQIGILRGVKKEYMSLTKETFIQLLRDELSKIMDQ